MNIPQLKDVKKAYEIYMTRVTLSTKDIQELFGVAHTYANRLRIVAKEKEIEKGLPQFSTTCVRTDEAFKTWGLDIRQIRRRAK